MGYAITDKLIATVARSNFMDNIDFRAKYKLLQVRSDALPTIIALQAGVGWNTEVPGRGVWDADNGQYYAQLILNTLIKSEIAVGVVPSYVYNFATFSDDTEHSLVVGLYGQWYISHLFSMLAEWKHFRGRLLFPLRCRFPWH